MHLEQYAFTTTKAPSNYEFTSDGQNGKIRKVVAFRLIDAKRNIYNLGFGDFNEATGKVDDLSVSNNQDRNKILATIAAIVADFSEKFPAATIIAIGSTESRTRLYRMGISQHLEVISKNFDIEGFNNGWETFEKGKHYEAFSIRRKNA